MGNKLNPYAVPGELEFFRAWPNVRFGLALFVPSNVSTLAEAEYDDNELSGIDLSEEVRSSQVLTDKEKGADTRQFVDWVLHPQIRSVLEMLRKPVHEAVVAAQTNCHCRIAFASESIPFGTMGSTLWINDVPLRWMIVKDKDGLDVSEVDVRVGVEVTP